jgi:hypothetical protein
MTAWPLKSTAAQNLAEGQETDLSPPAPAWIVTGFDHVPPL